MSLPAFERHVLIERAFRVLEDRERAMNVAALAQAAMQMNGELPPPLLRLVEEKLVADGRFARTLRATGNWRSGSRMPGMRLPRRCS